MGTARISGLGMALSPGETMGRGRHRVVLNGEEAADDAFDMVGDDGADLILNGWVMYCLMRDSWLGKYPLFEKS
jgi:hypothetical protein